MYSDSFDVYTGNANDGLARKICRYLGVPLGQAEGPVVGRFYAEHAGRSAVGPQQIGRASCRERVFNWV